jgi:hypothetical protein
MMRWGPILWSLFIASYQSCKPFILNIHLSELTHHCTPVIDSTRCGIHRTNLRQRRCDAQRDQRHQNPSPENGDGFTVDQSDCESRGQTKGHYRSASAVTSVVVSHHLLRQVRRMDWHTPAMMANDKPNTDSMLKLRGRSLL